MIYVYALSDPLDALPVGEPGFEDALLETVVEGGVGAVFSACGSAPSPNPDNLWRHEVVTESVMRRGAALPTRFGTTLGDVTRLRAVLARNQPVIRTALDHVRGCVEVGVRVLTEEVAGTGADRPTVSGEAVTHPTSSDTGAGREYLLRRLADERRRMASIEGAETVVADVHEPLARQAREAVQRPARGPGVLAAAYLVERERLDGFVAAVRTLDEERDERQVLCTGPWPPYSFVPTLELDGVLSG